VVEYQARGAVHLHAVVRADCFLLVTGQVALRQSTGFELALDAFSRIGRERYVQPSTDSAPRRAKAIMSPAVLFNSSYSILEMDLGRMEAESAGERSRSLLGLAHLDLDFVKPAEGRGVPATGATAAEELTVPRLVEAVVGRGIG